MRHKMITLCPTTYEIAQKMPNFSAWIRQQLLNNHATEFEAPKGDLIWGATCVPCDLVYRHKDRFKVEEYHYCTKCGKQTNFIGIA